jgi:hypothetical protein
MSSNRLIALLLTLGVLLQYSPAPLTALELVSGDLTPVPIPPGSKTILPILQADLNNDGLLESLVLNAGLLSIYSNDQVTWYSPPDWKIVQAAIGDVNHDGKPEAILLLWRPFQPWPTDGWLTNGGRIAAFHDAALQSCHIILIGWKGAGFGELWAGSAMADPIKSFAVADLDGDKFQELVVLEGRYANHKSAPAPTFKVWKWNGFGFSIVSSMDGIFTTLTLVQTQTGQVLILFP